MTINFRAEISSAGIYVSVQGNSGENCSLLGPDSSEDTVTGYALNDFVSSDHRGRFFMGKIGKAVKLTTHLHLVSWSRTMELYLHPQVSMAKWLIN
jgi:hypothetical protein